MSRVRVRVKVRVKVRVREIPVQNQMLGQHFMDVCLQE